ncbi:MAG: hypothetical protein LBP74_02040 [Treponema sp.]|jgi:hypothetical protein|nr:hypothetical protein [Treponema sp.]
MTGGFRWLLNKSSKENAFFHGMTDVKNICNLPFYGFVHSLIRHRIPWFPLNAKNFMREKEHVKLLILPDLSVMDDEQIGSVEQIVKEGKKHFFRVRQA